MSLIMKADDPRLTGNDILNGLVPGDLVTESLRVALEERDSARKHHTAEYTDRMSAERDLTAAIARFTVPIVCICGSTRFKQSWIAENARLTGEGNIVLAVGLWGHHERKYPDAETKEKLDALHLRKIDLCDWVWVLDIGGYIGESTRNEIAYAEAHGKLVRYLSKEIPDYAEPVDPLAARAEDVEKIEDLIEEHLAMTLGIPAEWYEKSHVGEVSAFASAIAAYLKGM